MTDQAILDRLAAGYGGDVAARALWLQAGGPDEDVVYDESSEDRWQAMWNAALLDGEGRDLALVREMLLDAPWDSGLLDFVRDRAAQSPDFERDAVAVVVEFLESCEPMLDADEGWPLLLLLSPLEGPAAFAVFLAAVDERFTIEQRSALDFWLTRIVEGELLPGSEPAGADAAHRLSAEATFRPTMSGIGHLVRRLTLFFFPENDGPNSREPNIDGTNTGAPNSDGPMGDDSNGEAGEDHAVLEALIKRLREDADAWAYEPGALDAAGAREARESLDLSASQLTEGAPDGAAAQRLAGLMQSLAGALGRIEDGEAASVTPRAYALATALWSTRACKAPEVATEE